MRAILVHHRVLRRLGRVWSVTSTGEAISLFRETLSEQQRLRRGNISLRCPIDVLLRIVVMSQILRSESLYTTSLFLVILAPRRSNNEKNGSTLSKPNEPNGNQQSTLHCVQCTLNRRTTSLSTPWCQS